MIQVIRALCDKQVYTRLSRIPLDAFEKEPRAIVRALGEAHEKFDHDISPADLKVWFHSKNPGLTKSQRDAYDLLLAKLRDVEPMSPEMVEDVLRDMTRVELGRQIGESGFALMEGHTTSSDTLRALLDMYDAGMAGETSPMVAEDLDPEALLSTLNHEERWAFNLSSLKERVPGLSPGHFCVIGSRPETGKTTSHASFAVAPGGWVEQGARVHVLCNEEKTSRVALRYYTSAYGVPQEQLDVDMIKASDFNPFDLGRLWIGRIPDDAGLEGVEAHIKQHRPDILVIDMLDKVSVGKSDALPLHEKLRELYRRTRDLATRHDIVVVGYSQLSADAEGRTNLNLAMLEGSKTGKAAEADIMILIGRYGLIEGAQENDPRRVLNVAKNKISGWHGQIHCVIDGRIGRYDD